MKKTSIQKLGFLISISLICLGGFLLANNIDMNFSVINTFSGSMTITGQGQYYSGIYYSPSSNISIILGSNTGNINYHIKGDLPNTIDGSETDQFTIIKQISLLTGEGLKNIQTFFDKSTNTTAFVSDINKIFVDQTQPSISTLNQPIKDNSYFLFSWSTSTDNTNTPVSYHIIIASDNGLKNIILQQQSWISEILIPQSNLPQDGFYWTILSEDLAGNQTTNNTNHYETNTKQTNNGGIGYKTNLTQTTNTETNTQTESKKPKPDISFRGKVRYSEELVDAYQYAYSRNITTKSNIFDAELKSPLLRKHLAKMISQYAINVLDKKPDDTKICNFSDIDGEDLEMNYYIRLSCKLGLMGHEADGITISKTFTPNKEVSRAEWGTVFSRLLYGLTNNTNITEQIPRYSKHLTALQQNNIMFQTIPDMTELRGYVMLMMMRSDTEYQNKSIHTSAK